MTKKEHLYELDILRFSAAMMVVFFHFCYRGFAADNMTLLGFPEWAEWARYGYLGVNLFFIISGFVIFMSAENRNSRDFLILRALRLFPAFWLCCSISFVAIYFWGFPQFVVPIQHYFLNLTLLADYFDVPSVDGAYWSLYVEINFYLLVYLTLLFKQFSRIEKLMNGWLVLSLVSYFFPIGGTMSTLLRLSFAPYFIAGGFFYMVYAKGNTISRMVSLLVAFVAIILYSIREAQGVMNYYNTKLSVPLVIGFLALCYVLFSLIITNKLRFLKIRWFTYLGVITYPLYLLHQRVGFIIFNHFFEVVNKFALLFGVIFLLLIFSYLIATFIEAPMMRFGRRKLIKQSLRKGS